MNCLDKIKKNSGHKYDKNNKDSYLDKNKSEINLLKLKNINSINFLQKSFRKKKKK
jgi:hypothetical protein